MLNGYGRTFLESQIYDGNFKNGALHGDGINYNVADNTHIYGEFEMNFCKNLISSGAGFPKEIICIYFFV